MAESPDPRTFSRISLDRGVLIQIGDATPFHAEIVNLSMSGLLVKSGEHLEPGTECRISIPLTESGEDELRIEAMASVARPTTEGFAVSFMNLLGIESYNHLRSLLLYNASDPDQIDAEFKLHYGIR